MCIRDSYGAVHVVGVQDDYLAGQLACGLIRRLCRRGLIRQHAHAQMCIRDRPWTKAVTTSSQEPPPTVYWVRAATTAARQESTFGV